MCVFIDLSKAFDTVNHDILLYKLKHYGIKGSIFNWLKSYLTNRNQFVLYKNTGLLDILCGVPHGSILGSLLFLLYINDMHRASNIISTITIADDTNLFLTHNNIKEMFSLMNCELEKFNNWFKSNKLFINTDKTKFILFHKSRQNINLPLKLPDLKINNNKIEQKQYLKFLGVIVDENVSWKPHISALESKISQAIGNLYKARPLLNEISRKQLYFSLVHTHLTYANISWGSTHPTKLQKLYSLQKHVCKVVNFKGKYARIGDNMKRMKALTVFDLNTIQNIIFMFKFKLNLLPNIFSNFFQMKMSDKHNLRSNFLENYLLPKKYSKFTESTISYRGPKLWNSFKVTKIKSATNVNTFKTNLKKYLLSPR